MDLWLNIVLIVGPLFLGTYLSTVQGITGSTKILVWIVCGFVCISGVYRTWRERTREKRREEKEAKEKTHDRKLLERQELRGRGLPTPYINGLGGNPLLKHSFNIGQRHEKESRFKEAIEEYEECLSHPNATEENKVAANILIGNCYYVLSKLKEAKKYYEEAFSVSKRVKDKGERLQGRGAALGNIGLIYRNLGKPDEALKYHQEALKIHKNIGYEQGIANQLGNIGPIYSDLGKPDEALKYFQDALEIFKRIGAQLQIKRVSMNINAIKEERKS